MSSLHLAFDIGHSSIGWSVLSPSKPTPEIFGCGSVIFPKDDCLACSRRDHRRTRRNIRATRQRIERLKRLLLHLKVLSADELNSPGHPAPHMLSARAILSEKESLSWLELWHVLRWYAHNRGYDGNSRWARLEEADSEDTEKEKAALQLMQEHGTTTMAETICAALGLNPRGKKISSTKAYKTLNAAFPRKVVQSEVAIILEKHRGSLSKLDDALINTLIATNTNNEKQAWSTISVPEIKLPRRYFGGLLFGQLIPRFDNRIIAQCPISDDKVPNKSTSDFLKFRWAMLLANIKAGGKSLSAEQRQSVNCLMLGKGRLTPTELRIHVESITGTQNTNIRSSFEIHPDSKDALELDPALAYASLASLNKKNTLYPYWRHLPETSKKRAIGRWKKGRPVDLNWMLEQCDKESHPTSPLQEEIDKTLSADKKKAYLSKEHLLRKSFSPKPLSGRAPYSRQVMRNVSSFVLSTDRHPTEKETNTLPAGPIYRSKKVLSAERDKPIAELTNNHLIRQRLDILLRLTDDIIANYADGRPQRISDIVVEVARDLTEFSGLTAEKIARSLRKRLSHFKSAVTYLEKHAPNLPVSGSLIRKCRIAMDLDWHCPFTNKRYDALDLPQLEREHIIPYADRPTNSLDSLVLTFSWVNKLKGKRTAMQFIQDVADDERFMTPKQYTTFVKKLKTANKKSYTDDNRRQMSRKRLMLVEEFEAKDIGFTQGALTQTSHLNRLSARQLEKKFIDPVTGETTVRISTIPGQVTAETRKSWNLLHTLDRATPECAGKNKTEIRNITHLHHALDAATLSLTHYFLPGSFRGQAENEKGAVWTAMLKRNKSEAQVALLLRTGMYKPTRKDGKPDAELVDIHKSIKANLSARIAERRVVQHIPSDQSGAHLEQMPWRVDSIQGSFNDPNSLVHISQTTSIVEKGIRVKKVKNTTERAGKLIGLKPGKLYKNKAVLVISDNYGIALEPSPAIIPFHDVPKRIAKIIEQNENQHPQILRKGMIIKISYWPGKEGTWRIFSCKAPAHIDLARTDVVTMESKGERFWRQVSVNSLIKKGSLEIINCSLTGSDSHK